MTASAELKSPSGRVTLSVADYPNEDHDSVMAELGAIASVALATATHGPCAHHAYIADTFREAAQASFLLILTAGEPFPNGERHIGIAGRSLRQILPTEVMQALDHTLQEMRSKA